MEIYLYAILINLIAFFFVYVIANAFVNLSSGGVRTKASIWIKMTKVKGVKVKQAKVKKVKKKDIDEDRYQR